LLEKMIAFKNSLKEKVIKASEDVKK